jgi:cellulose biosynthesis protein BcsQ/tetratricopeptide (TPR) repeat protein
VICTFYSYKGGVGRSMALANVGEWFYLHGLRVVLVDWDLEAPGLEAFFPSDEDLPSLNRQPGLIDLLLDYKQDLPYLTLPPDGATQDQVVAAMTEQLPPLRSRLLELRQPVQTGGSESALWILPAGKRDAEAFATYARAVQRFDWNDFYQRDRGEAFFEWLRRELLAEDLADIVLIDTRTGISEMGGVATRQLADVIVSFCVPNTQNIEGVRALTESFLRPDVTVARGRSIATLIVPTRIENSEIDARNAAKREFGIAMDHLLPETMTRERRSFWDLRIPYVPKYAYRETLAVGAPDSAEELVAAYEALALQLLALAPEGTRAHDLASGGLEASRSEPVSIPNVSNVPPRVPLVVGRQGLLSEMRSRLTEIQAPLVLYGLAGVGKTTLVIEFAHRFQPDYDVTWWIDASSPERIAAGYTELAREVGADRATEDPIAAARRWLASHSGWLLVLDAASDPEAVREDVPREQRGHVLITSRNPRWGSVATALEVPVLDRRDSVELLRRRTGDVDPVPAGRLAAALGDLPLALSLACAYIEATGRSTGDYLELFEREGARLLAGRPHWSQSPSLGQTWEPLYRELLRDPLARDLLALCSMLAAQEIPIDLLAQGKPHGAGGAEFLADPPRLDEAIVGLRRYSFVTTQGRDLWIHPLLQAFVRDWLGEKVAARTAGTAVRVVREAFPADGLADSEVAERLLPHARAAVDHATERAAAAADVVELLAVVARNEQAQGEETAARATVARAVEHALNMLGPKHPVVDAVTRARVALLIEQGDLSAAEAALEQDLARAQKQSSETSIVRVLGDLGVVMMRRGEAARAEQVTREALAIAQELRGSTELARVQLNLSMVLTHRGDVEGAKEAAAEGAQTAREVPADEGRDALISVASQLLESVETPPVEGLLQADIE